MTASSERETLRAAERIGYPVVVKPYNGNHGRGVCINLRTPEEVARGYEVASKISRTVVVETYLTGFDHRMLVVNGELVAAAKRIPGACDRRWHAFDQGPDRDRQQRPAPRHRPRRC